MDDVGESLCLSASVQRAPTLRTELGGALQIAPITELVLIDKAPARFDRQFRMSLQRPLQRVLCVAKRVPLGNGSIHSRSRCFATATADSGTLPLAGIRVLDMTRVLAGVSCMIQLPSSDSDANMTWIASPTVRKFSETLGMRDEAQYDHR